MAYYLYRIAGWLLPRIPGRVGYLLATWAGRIIAELRPRERAMVRSNLRHVLGPEIPERRLDSIVRQTYVHMAKNYYDMFRVPAFSLAHVGEMVKVTGLEHLAGALAGGRGAIVCSIHYGAPDVVAQRVATIGLTMTVPAEHLKPEKLYQYVCSLRSAHGLRLVPSDSLMIELFRALKRNELVALTIDRDTTHSGRDVEFFGAPAVLPDGAAQLALRTQAPLVPAFGRRLPDDSYEVTIKPPIRLEPSDNRDEAVVAGMRRLLSVVEEYLREDPSQWVLFRRVWND